MPVSLDPNSNSSRAQALTEDLGYRYPKGLDLRPTSELHRKLVTLIKSKARISSQEMSKKYPSWRKIDENLTAFIQSDADEEKIKDDDSRKPVSMVVPFTFATLETLLTYLVAVFFEDPVLRYEGFSPEDTIGAILMEKVVSRHCQYSKVPLSLHTMFRDNLAYGFGAVAPIWEVTRGFRTVKKPRGYLSAIYNRWVGEGEYRAKEEGVLFEGNALENIDPYLYLPDPNVPIHAPQKGEFVGWIIPTNYMALLEKERYANGELFNVKYLNNGGSNMSEFNKKDESGRDTRFGTSISQYDRETRPIDTLYMYLKLVPKEYGLGSSEYPEKWLFGLGGDDVVIMAKPLGLNHDRFPVAVCATDFDGHGVVPISRLEVVYPLQHALDWFFSSHVANVRKAINDMFVVDPSLINMNDFRAPGAGKLLRLRRSAWGRGVNDAVKQLQVGDVTRGHIEDSMFLVNLLQRVSGASDTVMGIRRETSERVSATESRGVQQGALSRLAKMAKIASLQAMHDIGYLFAAHTQQLMKEEVYVNVAGLWPKEIQSEFGDVTKKKVSPYDLLIDYDCIIKDGTLPDTESGALWIQLYQIFAQNPSLANRFDMLRFGRHTARMLGAKNVEDFIISVQPEERVQNEVLSGNLVPMNLQGGGGNAE